ncbi:MAG TPA: NAD-dependent epimerase/dehydratase family protein [Bacteroidales bacterium]|nr:NAD-dependent epimerase/dehydratase family protein [Bacteroidales bacterium]
MDNEKGSKNGVYRVLVTGADGMLGNNIVRELVARGHEVSCFIEASHDGKYLKSLPVSIYKGNLMDEKTLASAFDSVDYVVHTAGITAMWPARSELSRKVNVDAVKLLTSLAKKHNIKRFVHIGTATSFGHGTKDSPGTEESPYTNSVFKLDYQDTKYEAQEYLIREYRENNFPVIILNPTFMLGKYDNGNGSNKMVLYTYKEKLPGYSPGGKNYVYVNDVAVAAVNALDMGRLGECYITGNRNLSYKEALTFIAKTLEVKPPSRRLPRFASLVYGATNSVISFFTRKPPPVSYRMARIGCEECYYSPEKAIRELKMPQTPIEEGIRDSIDWFRERGMVD